MAMMMSGRIQHVLISCLIFMLCFPVSSWIPRYHFPLLSKGGYGIEHISMKRGGGHVNAAPRRMPTPKARNLETIKKLLVDLVELKDVELAPNLLAPHIQAIITTNITKASEELIQEQELFDNTSFGYQCITAACDYVTTFADEFHYQTESIAFRHREVLKSIVDVAKTGNTSQLSRTISLNTPNFTSAFLLHLRNERKWLDEQPGTECAALASLLFTVETRIINELEMLTTADMQVFKAILDTKRKSFSDDVSILKDVVMTTLEKRDEYGKRRFIAFVRALKDNTSSSKDNESSANETTTTQLEDSSTPSPSLNSINSIAVGTTDEEKEAEAIKNLQQSEVIELIDWLEKEIFPVLKLPENGEEEPSDGINNADIVVGDDSDGSSEKENFLD